MRRRRAREAHDLRAVRDEDALEQRRERGVAVELVDRVLLQIEDGDLAGDQHAEPPMIERGGRPANDRMMCDHLVDIGLEIDAM